MPRLGAALRAAVAAFQFGGGEGAAGGGEAAQRADRLGEARAGHGGPAALWDTQPAAPQRQRLSRVTITGRAGTVTGSAWYRAAAKAGTGRAPSSASGTRKLRIMAVSIRF